MDYNELYNSLSEIVMNGGRPDKNEKMKSQVIFQHGSTQYSVKKVDIKDGKIILLG